MGIIRNLENLAICVGIGANLLWAYMFYKMIFYDVTMCWYEHNMLIKVPEFIVAVAVVFLLSKVLIERFK